MLLNYYLDIFFSIIFIKKNKSKKLSYLKIKKNITFIPLDKF